ncbi:MAG: molybdopterin-synthase adenylyltransferase MoeB [Xanthomonadaceae bacterium]|nr:molybdopterin-synthase adenylyltransferase MoeB [Xanthomonadaceae bacterium]
MSAPDAVVLPIPQVDVVEARRRQLAGALLIDVRTDGERAAGSPEGAIGMPSAQLPLAIAELAPPGREILLICLSGPRSLRAAQDLRARGCQRIASVAGGYVGWLAAGLPVQAGGLDADAQDRYARQLCLPEIGGAGQARLAAARVALVGAGGLGAPAALYLAAAGVGTLTLIDDDRVERSNLHRQVLHTDARVGLSKVESARMTLAALNPRVQVVTHAARVQADNVEVLLGGHDVVIDGADNFPTRYLLAAASLRLRLPLVYGAVERFSGQVSVFDPRRAGSPCYRCLFPEPPAAADAPNCAEAGVLGVLPGVIGLLQATEALKLLLGIGTPLVGRLLLFDALAMCFRELRLPRDAACPGCGATAHFSGYEDLARLCAAAG